jgi:hypothetical protein
MVPQLKRPGCEANHSLPSTAEVKERVELYLHSPNTLSRRGAQKMHGDNFTFIKILNLLKNLDSSVSTATGYGLDDWMIEVRFPAGAGNFSPHHRVQTGSGAHPASYPMGTTGSFPGGKAAGA